MFGYGVSQQIGLIFLGGYVYTFFSFILGKKKAPRQPLLSENKDTKKQMFKPATVYLQQYRECLKKRNELRKSLLLPQDGEEDQKFCKKYYRLYVAKLVSDLL